MTGGESRAATGHEPGFDGVRFREVIGNFMTGVTVITTRWDGADRGMSASAVASLSMDPPMLLACLHSGSPTQAAIADSGVFCVNVLAEGQEDLAMRFAQPREDKFDGLRLERGRNQVPLLADALAWLECEVESGVVGGSHRVFLSRVRAARSREGSPLAYFRGGFGRVEMSLERQAEERVRDAVLTRVTPIDRSIEAAELADRLDLSRPQVSYALVRLEYEGLVERRPDGEVLPVPVDARASDEAFDARCAIELGAAELAVGRLEKTQLRELRTRAEATTDLIRDGHFVDVRAYTAKNAALHEYLVGLAGSPPLLDAYRRLSLPTLMSRLFNRHDAADERLVLEHLALTEAFESEDVAAAKRVIAGHTERAKETNAAALAAADGRV